MHQEMVVIGNEWNFCCCTERREFSIVRIFDEDKVVEIDAAGKLTLWPKEVTELIPTEERNSAQNKLGFAPRRFVPDQLKAPVPDSREDTLRCASRVEARGYEDIRVDDNPFHSDFIYRKLVKGLGTYANGEGVPIPERSLEVGRRCECRHIADFRTEEHIIGDMPQTTRRTDAPNRRATPPGSHVQISARMRLPRRTRQPVELRLEARGEKRIADFGKMQLV